MLEKMNSIQNYPNSTQNLGYKKLYRNFENLNSSIIIKAFDFCKIKAHFKILKTRPLISEIPFNEFPISLFRM